jgi:hypothetical protein
VKLNVQVARGLSTGIRQALREIRVTPELLARPVLQDLRESRPLVFKRPSREFVGPSTPYGYFGDEIHCPEIDDVVINQGWTGVERKDGSPVKEAYVAGSYNHKGGIWVIYWAGMPYDPAPDAYKVGLHVLCADATTVQGTPFE